MTFFRQNKYAALVYTNSEDELKRLKNSRKTTLTIIFLAFVLAVLATLFLLGAFYAEDTSYSEGYGDYEDITLSSTLLDTSSYSESGTLYTNLSDKLLRLHIVANSDSDADQAVKLLVRNAVVAWISENMSEALTKEEAMLFLSDSLTAIGQLANEVLSDNGFDYLSTAEITVSHFPGKVYGDFYLPAGDYDALKIVLGCGAGKNWWCLAFPALCLYGNADYEDESGKRSSYPFFQVVIDEDEYEEIKIENVKIDFKCRWLKKIFG